VISELAGVPIKDECELCSLLRELSSVRDRYQRVAQALEEVETTGYGIVTPTLDEMRLEEPEIIRRSGSYGVKLKASGPSIHMIRAGIETEISPIVGTEQQSEDLVKYLLKEFDDVPAKLWDSNLFGKTLRDLITEGLHAKLAHIPQDARGKLSDTLARIINEGSGGLICILL
jgi:stage IV sporulation protein A